MKPTQITELFVNIRKSFVSFFSILMFVALGVGVFVGIYWTSPALKAAATAAFDEGSFHDIQVIYPYGLTEDDLAQLASVEGVSEVEPVRQAFAEYKAADGKKVVKLQTMGEGIDVLSVVEGRLPEKADELALNACSAEELGIHVGDSLTFIHDAGKSAEGADEADADGMKQLTSDAFTVTALVNSPEYLSKNSAALGYSTMGSGAVNAVAWVPPASFDDKAYFDGYTIANVRSDDLRGKDSFDEECKQASVVLEERIADLGGKRAPARYEALHSQAEQAVADGEAQLADAEKKLAEGEQAIQDGTKQLEEARVTLDQAVADGEAMLADAYQKLQDGESLKKTAEKNLAEARSKLSAAREGLSKFDAAVQDVTAIIADLEQFRDNERAAYNDAVQAADEAKQETENAAAQLEAADSDLQAAQAALEQCEKDHEAGKATDAQLVKAQKAYDDAQAKQAEAEDRYKQAQENQAAAEEEAASAEQRYDEALDAKGAEAAERLDTYAQMAGLSIPAPTHENIDEFIDQANDVLPKLDECEVTIEGQTMTVREAREKLPEYEQLLASKQAEFDSKVAQLKNGWDQYYAGQQRLEEERAAGEQRIAEGQAKLEEVKKQVDEGRELIEKKKPELEEAKHRLTSMSEYDWTVSGRSYNGGVMEVSILSGMTARLSMSMAALFVIVGLLVSYSAVSRIVYEQITQIGTKKALGFRSREITMSFMAYSALAVLVGSISGIIAGIVLVEGVIGNAFAARFVMGGYPPYFGLPLGVGMTLLELALILGTTWLACKSVLRGQAVELLKGEKPPEAKTRFYERWGIWEKLPLFTQTIVNNCMNDKRRVFSTIVGVAGCTALIVTAITLNDNVLASYEEHYQDVYGFNAIAYVDADQEGAADSVEAALRESGAQTAQVRRQSFSMTQPDGTRGGMRAFIPVDEKAFDQLYHVDVVNGEPFDPAAEGVWVSEAYATHMGAKVGDELVLDAGDGTTHRFTIKGFYRFFLVTNELVMGKGQYRSSFGAAAEPNAVLADTGEVPLDDIAAPLEKVAGFDSLADDKTAQRSAFTSFSSISRTVVLIYLALAALMAIVVLLNLNVMFIAEKKRELIVLMINGFSVKHAKRYIYNDTIVLTVIGIIVGIVLGCAVGSVTVGSMEPDMANFLKGIAWRAVAVGAVGSAVLATIMSVISLRLIPRFRLTDINKV